MSWWDTYSGTNQSAGSGHNMLTDPNPLTGYLSSKAGFNEQNPLGSINNALGLSVAKEPGTVDLSKIAGTDQATSQNLLQQIANYQAQQQSAFGGQSNLANTLYNTITNPNAPSVARTQLGEGLDAITRAQLGASAGTSGVNAANARLAAMGNAADAAAKTNQAQGLVRAQEVAAAQGNLGNVYNSEQQGAGAFANVLGNTGVGEGKTAESAGGENQTLLEKENEYNAKQNSNLAGTIGNFIAAL
jgi:hypothetical protein